MERLELREQEVVQRRESTWTIVGPVSAQYW